MSTEYESVRVRPETKARLLSLQEKVSARMRATTPGYKAPNGHPLVPLGQIISDALDLYEQALGGS